MLQFTSTIKHIAVEHYYSASPWYPGPSSRTLLGMKENLLGGFLFFAYSFSRVVFTSIIVLRTAQFSRLPTYYICFLKAAE